MKWLGVGPAKPEGQVRLGREGEGVEARLPLVLAMVKQDQLAPEREGGSTWWGPGVIPGGGPGLEPLGDQSRRPVRQHSAEGPAKSCHDTWVTNASGVTNEKEYATVKADGSQRACDRRAAVSETGLPSTIC